MQIILASQSPRRQELLKRVVPTFTIAPADIDETVGKDGLPAEYVAQMATQKAAAIAEQSPEALVIGCDTIVALAGEILGKPTSREDGYRMLRLLSGKTHDVYTSVTFYPLTDTEIHAYLDTAEYADKAGAYGIQGQGALLIEAIAGDYYAIMGLPIAKVARLLKEFN
ncbi:Maf-like protein [Enterococcus faecalis]|nr:Maf-like protein [Enterococcus faecalis]